MQKFDKKNLKELEFFKDTLESFVEEGFEITMPEILSINKTNEKYVNDEKNKSFIIVNEIDENNYKALDKEDTVIMTLVIKNKNKIN